LYTRLFEVTANVDGGWATAREQTILIFIIWTT